MLVVLFRHGRAGRHDASAWPDDRLRPLSKEGRRQADSLARRLARLTTGELVSSPFERCLQTLQPLSAVLRMAVREDERLGEELLGDPKERDPDLVKRDVADGLVSPAVARSIYGVKLD